MKTYSKFFLIRIIKNNNYPIFIEINPNEHKNLSKTIAFGNTMIYIIINIFEQLNLSKQ